MTLRARPITQKAAYAYVARLHRHHKPPTGDVFRLSAVVDGEIVGVAVVGRPTARMLDNGTTAEVLRTCTDGTKNANSFLYARCWRIARAMGYDRIITYTLPGESGASLRAAGWICEGEYGGGSWDRTDRPRDDSAPLCKKLRWRKGHGWPLLAEKERP